MMLRVSLDASFKSPVKEVKIIYFAMIYTGNNVCLTIDYTYVLVHSYNYKRINACLIIGLVLLICISSIGFFLSRGGYLYHYIPLLAFASLLYASTCGK